MAAPSSRNAAEGDSHFVVFERPSAAVAAACALQLATNTRQPGGRALRIRIGVHAGEADPIADDYYGIAVNQAARLRGVAHGGQTVVSQVVAALARTPLSGKVHLKSLGHHRVRDFPKLEEVFQATVPGVEEEFPPLRTSGSKGPAMMAITVIDVIDSKSRVAVSHSDDVIEWQRQTHRGRATRRRAPGTVRAQVHGRRMSGRFRGPGRRARIPG